MQHGLVAHATVTSHNVLYSNTSLSKSTYSVASTVDVSNCTASLPPEFCFHTSCPRVPITSCVILHDYRCTLSSSNFSTK